MPRYSPLHFKLNGKMENNSHNILGLRTKNNNSNTQCHGWALCIALPLFTQKQTIQKIMKFGTINEIVHHVVFTFWQASKQTDRQAC